MNVPSDLSYTKEHEWLRIESDQAVVGITDYAQGELGDVVFVELPEVGSKLASGETFGSLESVKAVSDVYMPVSGTVLEVNEGLEDTPEAINESPYEKGWIVRISLDDRNQLEGLMNGDQYQKYVSEEA